MQNVSPGVSLKVRHDVSMQKIRGLYCSKSVSTPRQLRMPDLAQKITSITRSYSGRGKKQIKINRVTSSAKHNEIRHHLRHGAVVTCVHFFSATVKSHVIAFVAVLVLLLCFHFFR